MIHKHLSEHDYKYLFNHIKYISKNFLLQGLLDRDEIISAGLFGIAKGLISYDKSYNTNIKTYLYYKIHGEIKDTIRNFTKSRHKYKAPDFVYTDEVEILDNQYEFTLANEIRKLFNTLKGNNRKVMELLYINNSSMYDTSKKLNISESRVSQINSNCIDLLRKEINNDTGR